MSWDKLEEIFNTVWGKEMQSLPKYPKVRGGVNAHWVDEKGREHHVDELHELAVAYDKGLASEVWILSSAGQEPDAQLGYYVKTAHAIFRVRSSDEQRISRAYEIVKKYFPEHVTATHEEIKNYIDLDRIAKLRSVRSMEFDLKRLIRLCEELNIAFEKKSYLSTGMIVRSIINYVPPIFGFETFKEVVAGYGSKSFKESMNNLDVTSRKIADSFQHSLIRKHESVPNANQVDFINELDVLLSEILIRLS